MRQMLLLLVAGVVASPALTSRPAAASEASQAPAEAAPERASPADTAPAADAPSAEAPADEQRRRVRARSGYRARPRATTHYQQRYYSSYRPYTSYRYSPPYYRSYYYGYTPPIVYAPPTVVVQPAPVMIEEPVYYQEPVAYASPTPVVYEAPEQPAAESSYGASFIVYFQGINESDTDLSFETIEGANLLGAGGALRFDLDDHWMIEAGIGLLGSENDAGVQQLSLPLSLSALAHLFPGSIVDPYGVAGLNVVFTEYDDPSFAEVESYTQFGGHLGFGTEINLGDWLISADLRFLFMNARPERDTILASSGGGGVSVRGDTTGQSVAPVTNATSDDLQTGLQFLIGGGWRF